MIRDLGVRKLLVEMLKDRKERLTIEESVELPMTRFYGYLQYEDDNYLAGVVNDFRTLPGFSSLG